MTYPSRLCLLALLVYVSIPATADDTRERQLEIDVEQLRRELQAQARRIDQLERTAARTGERAITESARTASPLPVKPPGWLVAANWDRVRVGMSEGEVVAILGPATSLRESTEVPGARSLLYALEIQEAVFLAARVELQSGRVSAVQKPGLR